MTKTPDKPQAPPLTFEELARQLQRDKEEDAFKAKLRQMAKASKPGAPEPKAD